MRRSSRHHAPLFWSRLGQARLGQARLGQASLAAVLVVASLASGPTSGASPAFAQAQAPVGASPTRLPIGQAGALPTGSSDLGVLAATTPLHLDVVMQPRDPSALASFIEQVYDPSSPEYHRFLTQGQFGPTFGAAPSTIAAVTSALSSLGLDVGQVGPDDLVLPVSTTAGGAQAAFGVQLHQYRLRSGRVAYANMSAPQVPSGIVPNLVGVLGLSDVATAQALGHTLTVKAGKEQRTAAAELPQASGPSPCSAATEAATDYAAYTSDQLAEAYGFGSAYSGDHLGQGTTIALYELETFLPSDISAFESCYGINGTPNIVEVDGGATTDQDDIEAALDIEDVASLAPDATIDVYEGPEPTPAHPNSVLDLYEKIADDDTAQVVSTSWGACETDLGSAFQTAEELVFEQMALQGQSLLAASGDTGSEDCYGTDGTDQLAVEDPASDPYVTAVGGTRLVSVGPPPSEKVWNDLKGSDGGGMSDLWPMPSWQRALGTGAEGASGTPCGDMGGYCREVPDVSASASDQSALVVYETIPADEDGNGPGWYPDYGTSVAAPIWAAFVALADQAGATEAGFLNPALYATASSHPSDLNEINIPSENNDFTGTNGGLYVASPAAYNMAVGLGSPTSALLAPGVLTTAPAVGPGSLTVSPSTVPEGSAGNTLTFTYTAPANGMGSGALGIVVPSAWTPPSTSSGPGYTTTTCTATLGVTASEIELTDLDLPGEESCTVTFSDATAPSAPGVSTFNALQGTGDILGYGLTTISPSPTVGVEPGDGLGTMVVYPTTVELSSTANTLTFTYTAAPGGTDFGALQVTVPTGWTAPQAAPSDSGSPGYVAISSCNGAGVTAYASSITVSGLTLMGGGTCSFTYSDATSPGSAGTSTFVTTEESTSDSDFQPLSTSPVVDVLAPTGSGGGGGGGGGGGLGAIGPPSAPTDVAVTAGNAELTLSWSAPQSTGGIPLEGYEVFMGSEPGAELPTPVNGSQLISGTTYTVTGLSNGTTYFFTVKAVNLLGVSPSSYEEAGAPGVPKPPTTPPVLPVHKLGYWMVGRDGGVFNFGSATNYGSLPGLRVRVDDIVGMAASPDGHGYWLAGANGAIYTFGDAHSYGSLTAKKVRVDDIVGMAATPSGNGYWLVGSNGRAYPFGYAHNYGPVTITSARLDDIVAIVGTPDGHGYWLAGANGAIYTFGDAHSYGSLTAKKVRVDDIVGMAATPSGNGYWLVGSNGRAYPFGYAHNYGSTSAGQMGRNVKTIGMARTWDGAGYWLVGADGAVAGFGDATVRWSLPGVGVPAMTIVGVAGA